VARAYWYLLKDEPQFRNQGLFETNGTPKPASQALKFAESALIPLGDPLRVDAGDTKTFIYRYGINTYVMWGAARPISFSGSALFQNPRGQPIDPPTSLSDEPFVVDGDISYQLGDSHVVADSFLEYGTTGPWTYFAKTPDGKLIPLHLVDWNWTSYMGDPCCKPLRINADTLAPAGDRTHPVQAVERYTAPKSESVEVAATWTLGAQGAGGVNLHLQHNGEEILSHAFVGQYRLSGLKLSLKEGDTLDFAIGPNTTVSGDSTEVRIQLLASVPN
jgi:hypothetical protein